MTNPLGPSQNKQDHSDKSDAPENKESEPKSSEGNKSLSFNEILKDGKGREWLSNSEKTNLEGRNETKDFSVGKSKFDARRTTDISKLLGEGNVTRDLSRSLDAQTRPGRDFTWSTTHMLDSSANIGLAIPLGLRQHFKLAGVEHKKEDNSLRFKDLKNEIDDFLKNIKLEDDSRLSVAERKDLYETMDALRNALNEDDLLSNSLHIARLLQHLRYIEEARKAVRLAMATDPKSALANQLFKELERVHPSDIAISPVITRTELTKSNLAKRIINFGKGKVIVVGDLLIDELLEGRPERISREAPVLILEHVETE
ncbi:MAG: hypothetical protein K8F91_11975, partial [Candidatus Obscuribacterales bacterium]|nr:hypothetical protein [Candidatus Obscuribacterales bacterium]